MGNGFVFLSHHHYDFMLAVERAVGVFFDKAMYGRLRQNAFDSTLSTQTVAVAWAREFARLFLKIFERKEEEDEPAVSKAGKPK
jgi:starch synthase